MSVSQPGERVPVGGMNSSGMRLPLLRTGDQNGNAFPVSSSSSSSSSPDSLQSLSSLDVDMECVMTTQIKMAGVSPAEEPPQTEFSESNENSVSVYVDADEDSWNDNLTLAMSIAGIREHSNGIQGDLHDDVSSVASNSGGRRDSSPDSAATEIPGDDDDVEDDEEGSFLSMSSDMVMRRISLSDSERLPSSGVSILEDSDTASPSTTAPIQAPLSAPLPDLCKGLEGRKSPHAGSVTMELQNLQTRGRSSPGLPDREAVQVGVDLPEEACPLDVLPMGEAADTEPGVALEVILSETIVSPDSQGFTVISQTSTPVQVSKGVDLAVSPFTVPQSPNEGSQGASPGFRKTKQHPGATRVKLNAAIAKTTVTTTSKPGKTDIKRFPKPDLKNVKSKIMSRPTSAPRTANQTQGKAAPANEKKAPDGVKRQRSSLGQTKVASLKPGTKPRPNQNAEPRVSNQSEKSRTGTVANGIRSTSSSSLGSELAVDGHQRTPGEGVPNGEEKGTTGGCTREDTTEGAGGETPAEQRRSNGTVSSKLGTSSARQLPQVKGRGAGGASNTGGPSLSPTSPAPVGGSLGSRLPPPAPPTTGKDGQTTGSGSPPRGRPSQPAGIPKPRVTDRPSGLAAPTVVTSNPKPSVNQGLGAARPAPTATASKLPVKNLPTSLSSSSLGSAARESNGSPAAPSKVPAPVVGCCKPEERPSRPTAPGVTQGSVKAPSNPLGFRTRAPSLPGRSTATGLKTPAVTSQVAGKQAQNPLQRAGSARLNRPTAAATVDKNKARGAAVGRTPSQTSTTTQAGGPNQPQPPQPDLVPVPVVPLLVQVPVVSASRPARAPVEAKPATVAQYQDQGEKKNRCIQQLRRLLEQGNRRIEALATVVQHLFTEREEALKLKKGLSLELSNLRDELISSSQCCERLHKEKEEVQVSLEEAVRRLQRDHQAELTGLEERLKAFYQAEWDKVHQAYQEEADKCRALMEQQLEEMRSRQETLRKNSEASHAQQMDTLKLTHDTAVQGIHTLELRKTLEQDLENLDKTLKETEATLTEKIQDLTLENEALSEKLRAEEERRRILAEKNLKDSHVLYLGQELESLKVVLEMKTKQLHQQDKKLMQMDKLMESNVKLEERLNKVQQENEDYRARMDKHTALSRQLSSEQAMLQQTLQKESKVNKRLSMENEELLWKLHNGDLASPRRLSPSSPFHSPRNSASFPTTAAPLSPTR
ncbi:microtubule-associated tumor suppressor 1 homolog isoform X2 [Coregonus clupeaformis]|uniref:microtubule-associated tumor suppressor 1 homolog isoform X2 n=1 Tax=Coregonus clupeaformis TaxID=59861 RepID=UPI001E1C2BF1|nr:microtubule-associated tumor suppressor 1 homolog isoform X2 [Coregonus clupeaformis]